MLQTNMCTVFSIEELQKQGFQDAMVFYAVAAVRTAFIEGRIPSELVEPLSSVIQTKDFSGRAFKQGGQAVILKWDGIDATSAVIEFFQPNPIEKRITDRADLRYAGGSKTMAEYPCERWIFLSHPAFSNACSSMRLAKDSSVAKQISYLFTRLNLPFVGLEWEGEKDAQNIYVDAYADVWRSKKDIRDVNAILVKQKAEVMIFPDEASVDLAFQKGFFPQSVALDLKGKLLPVPENIFAVAIRRTSSEDAGQNAFFCESLEIVPFDRFVGGVRLSHCH